MHIDISAITDSFPNFRVAVVIVDNLAIEVTRPADLDRLIEGYEIECRQRWSNVALSEIPGIAVWRRAYRAFGIKRTSYRSSVERLVKNAIAGRGLPRINSFVDAYNAISLNHVIPAGADDRDLVVGDVAFRYSRPGDSFVDLVEVDTAATGPSTIAGAVDPPKEGEVVYADGEKVLCRRWNWRQDARSLVTLATKRAIVTLQYNGAGDLDAAVADFTDVIGRILGGTSEVVVVDHHHPVAALP